MLSNRSKPAAKPRLSQAEVDAIAKAVRVGLFLHDNPNDTESHGWAFETGREPERKRLFELNPLTLWVSSCEVSAWRSVGSRQHNVLRSDFLGISVKQLGLDLGLRLEGQFAIENGPRLVPHIEMVVQLAVSMYRMEQPARQLQQDTLLKVIQRMLPELPPVPEVVGTYALAQAHQGYSHPGNNYMDNSVLINLRFSRVEYANWLLSNRFPDQAWTVISRGIEDHLATIDDETPPFLIEGAIEFDQVSTSLGQLIAYGSSSSKGAAQRKWMTDVEYRWISKFARVHPTQMIQCSAAEKLSPSFRLPDNMVLDPIMYQVVSFGVLAHAHWTALGAERWVTVRRQTEPDLIATWISAYDRMKCFQAAYVLYEQGFPIFGYGKGSVAVRVPRERLPELRDLAESMGMAWPTWNAIFNEYGYGTNESASTLAAA